MADRGRKEVLPTTNREPGRWKDCPCKRPGIFLENFVCSHHRLAILSNGPDILVQHCPWVWIEVFNATDHKEHGIHIQYGTADVSIYATLIRNADIYYKDYSALLLRRGERIHLWSTLRQIPSQILLSSDSPGQYTPSQT